MVSESLVSAENVIYEPFVLMGELRWSFLSLLQWRRKESEDKSIHHHFSFSILPLSSRKTVKEAPANLPQKIKCFINYVICRNWAVRSPAGTRLDSSSLVNKQVAQPLPLSTFIEKKKLYFFLFLYLFSFGFVCFFMSRYKLNTAKYALKCPQKNTSKRPKFHTNPYPLSPTPRLSTFKDFPPLSTKSG